MSDRLLFCFARTSLCQVITCDTTGSACSKASVNNIGSKFKSHRVPRQRIAKAYGQNGCVLASAVCKPGDKAPMQRAALVKRGALASPQGTHGAEHGSSQAADSSSSSKHALPESEEHESKAPSPRNLIGTDARASTEAEFLSKWLSPCNIICVVSILFW